MKFNLRRAAVALTAACALAVVAAAPASASATHTGGVTGGTIAVASTGQTTEVISLIPDTTSTCPASTVVMANANESSTTGTSTVTTISTTGRFFFGGTAATNHYIAVITGNSTTGTGASASSWTTATTPDSFTGLSLRLTVKIYLGSSTCTIVATNLKCTWTAIVPLNGTYSGDISHPTLSDVATATSATPGTMSLGGTCAAPFTTYTAGTATVSGMTIHITSS